MSEKRFVPSKYASHTHDVKTDKHYYVTDEYVGCRKLFDEIERLENENERLRTRLNNIKIYVEFQLQEAENDLKTSIKGGMPTGSLYEEINLLKDLQMVIHDVRD